MNAHLFTSLLRACFEVRRRFSVNSIAAFTAIFCLSCPTLLMADDAFWYLYTTSDSQVTITGYRGFNTKELTIPNSINGYPVTSIGDYAFYNYSRITSIRIPDGVTSIGNHAFDGCRELTSLIIPDSVTSIGDFAFYRCVRLTSINIPDGVTVIMESSFFGCVRLTSISIPDSVTTIEMYAFGNCPCLTSVSIPDGVTSIGDDAFVYCSGLTTAFFLGAAPTMGDDVFYGTASGFCITYLTHATGYTSPTWCGYASQAYSNTNGPLYDGPAWSDSTESQDYPDWYESDWYGWFYQATGFGGWIYSETNGWQYVDDLGGDNGIYAYDYATSSWWFTGESFYPYLYDYKTATWYYYISGNTPNRLFYDYGSMSAVNESDEF